jgi:type I restriction-modification system DNA methylase subunit
VTFFNGKRWHIFGTTYGKKGFFTNLFIDNRKNKNTNYISKDKTTFQSLKDDTAEDDLWKYLDKLLFLEEYTPEQIEEIKTHLNKFIVKQEDRDKMAELYEYIYSTAQTGGNLLRVPKRVTLRKSKVHTQA